MPRGRLGPHRGMFIVFLKSASGHVPAMTSDDREPRLSLFALTMLVGSAFLTIGVAVQTLNLPYGMWFTEVFIFLGIPFAMARVIGQDPLRGARTSAPRASSISLGAAVGIANYAAWAIPLQGGMQRVLPRAWSEYFDSAQLFQELSRPALVVVLGAVLIAAPLCEEYFFRGVLLRGLTKRYSGTWAVVFSAILFAAFHLDPVGFFARLELGLVFGWLTLRSGSLWAAVAAHAANNAVAMALLRIFETNETSALPEWELLGVAFLVGNGLLWPLLWAFRRLPAADAENGIEARRRQSLVRALAPWACAALVGVAVSLALDGPRWREGLAALNAPRAASTQSAKE